MTEVLCILKRAVFIAMFLILLSGTLAYAQKVYIASTPEQYLQIVLLADDDAYILYDLESTDIRLSHFCRQVSPDEAKIIVVTDELIREKLGTRSFRATVLVDSQELSLQLLGAEIARQIGGFVYFSQEDIPEVSLAHNPLVQIGGIKEKGALYFSNLSEGYEYYKSIRTISPILVSADKGEYSFVALRLASERNGMLIFRELESTPINEKTSVIWIAEPKNLSREAILDIYEDLDYFGTGHSIGFFSGFTAADLSLMVERNLYLTRGQSVGNNVLIVSESSTTRMESRNYKEYDQNLHVLGGSEATWSNFNRLMPSADLVMISAHGSSQGFRLHDRFVSGSMLPFLRPGIINISGCYAASGIDETQQENILLSFLRQGAAISIGSTGIGFSAPTHLSSPSVPLGEQVRLLNYYAWKNTGTKERAVLFGDPTLAFVEDSYELLGINKVRFSLPETYSRVFGEGNNPVFVYLPEMSVVRAAAITTSDGGRENLDDGLFGRLLSLPSGTGSFAFLQTKFDQGIITFSSSRSLGHYLNSCFRFVVVALETFFRDYLLNRGLFILLVLVATFFFIALLIMKIQTFSRKTLLLFVSYAFIYLGINFALKNRFDLRVFLIFFLVSYFPTLFKISIWKRIGLYLLGISLPSMLILPQLISQSRGLLHLLIVVVGFLLSTVIPICLIWVNDVLLPKFKTTVMSIPSNH